MFHTSSSGHLVNPPLWEIPETSSSVVHILHRTQCLKSGFATERFVCVCVLSLGHQLPSRLFSIYELDLLRSRPQRQLPTPESPDLGHDTRAVNSNRIPFTLSGILHRRSPKSSQPRIVNVELAQYLKVIANSIKFRLE